MRRLREWWAGVDEFYKQVLAIVLGLVAVIWGIILFVPSGCVVTAEEGFAFCTTQCNTSTLRLVSVDISNVEENHGYVCHCAVRESSLTGSEP